VEKGTRQGLHKVGTHNLTEILVEVLVIRATEPASKGNGGWLKSRCPPKLDFKIRWRPEFVWGHEPLAYLG